MKIPDDLIHIFRPWYDIRMKYIAAWQLPVYVSACQVVLYENWNAYNFLYLQT